MDTSRCRFCDNPLGHSFVDLGMSPLANSNVRPDGLHDMERFYPLHVFVCDVCLLVQLPEFESPEAIFGEYSYFSSYSESWLAHARDYTECMIRRFGFHRGSQVVEIASNDGYLLQYFRDSGIPVLGIEPARNVAEAAIQAGIPTHVRFFGTSTAEELVRQGVKADLLLGNNVLAHVPALNDFVRGLKILLKPDGVITMEFPHLLRLIAENQFDTIYHEHFSYFSFFAVEEVFARQGLTLFDVEELPTHGGSLRIYARHAEDISRPVEPRVEDLRNREIRSGFKKLESYDAFAEKVRRTKRKLLEFLIQAKEQGKTIAGYGAPAKGNTLLNYCGIRTDFLDYTVDRSPHKQGLYLPGTHVPIHHPDRIMETRPDYLLILPWNLREEIMRQMAYVGEWGCRFVVPIPEVEILS